MELRQGPVRPDELAVEACLLVAKESPLQYKRRTERCPPGYSENDRERCIDMKENRKKREWLERQRKKDREERERRQREMQETWGPEG